MPYRRLPNTDQARIRALKTAVAKGDASGLNDLPFSLNVLSEARNYLWKFELAQTYYVQCFEKQSVANRKHQANVKMARLFVSHFIQVLNMSVVRGEIKEVHKKLYGLATTEHNVPDLTSDAFLSEWGRKVIEGERQRTSHGGTPIYNPTIAKVRVHYDIFVEGCERQKGYQLLTARSLESLAAMRPPIDELILEIWNQVEAKMEEVVLNEVRLNKCLEYGLIYYYRTGEKTAEDPL